MFISPAWAECDISKFDIKHMREAHNQFKNEPNLESANLFFESIPNKFCAFNEIYGYPGSKEGHLYGLELYETLPKLGLYIDAEKLISKYVALASEAKWDADSVNYLQHSYYKVFFDNPKISIDKVMNLSEIKRETAISFLFDGPHPSNSMLRGKEKENICAINQQFCIELNQVEKELLQKEH